jgi:hypothetical protein
MIWSLIDKLFFPQCRGDICNQTRDLLNTEREHYLLANRSGPGMVVTSKCQIQIFRVVVENMVKSQT